MKSGFIDPNNHVPGLSGGDDWDDADGGPTNPEAPASFLPPRRSTGDSSPIRVEKVDPGLRIDASFVREISPESPRKIHVQEIGSQVVRLEQEAPAPPRVERITTFRERPAVLKEPLKTRGEGTEWGHVQRGPLRWILAMGGVVIAIVLLGIFLLPRINAPNAGREDQARPSPVDQNIASDDTVALNRLVLRQPEATRIFLSFAAAVHPDEILPMIRDGAALSEIIRARWQPLGLPSQWEPAEDTVWLFGEQSGIQFAVLSGRLPDNSVFDACFTAENDQLLLDWKATTGYGTATFPELESGLGNGEEIRGEISTVNFYTHLFPEEDYQAFRLTSPDGEHTVWCYASRHHPAFHQIAAKLQPGEIIQEAADTTPVTVHLARGPDGSLPNQWLIQELHHLDWVTP